MLKPIYQPSEYELHTALVQHLRWRAAPSLFWFHCPSGAYFGGAKQGAIMKSLGWIAGIPDIVAIHRGTPFGLELKKESGRLKPEQITVHAAMRAAGATVSTAFGLDEALDRLAEWGLLR